MFNLFKIIARNPKTVIAALLIAAAVGFNSLCECAVDIFPDISVPRVTIMTESGGLTAEEVEQLVTIPIESAINGIPGVTKVRSSSSGGLSFVWVDFDWNADLARVRFDVFDRLSRVKETLPPEAHTEIAPVVSVTGEIMLVALTAGDNGASLLDVREIAEFDLRTRLMSVPGIGEVAVMGGRLPEYRVAVSPLKLSSVGLTLYDIIEAARDSRTFLSAGYLADVAGDEVPLRQIARADTLEALRSTPIPIKNGRGLKLGDVATVSVEGAPRRGSASFNGRNAVVLSVQKAPGGNTPKLTEELEKVLTDFAGTVKSQGISVHTDAYRQTDFIVSSIEGGSKVVRDAVIVVVIVLLIVLLEVRTLLVVLCTMPISILLGVMLFPVFGLGINVMTLGGFAVAAGDIVDASIIFTEVIRRKLGENNSLSPELRRPAAEVISSAAVSVAPGVLFSTLVIVLVFVPLLMLSGLEGRFFRPLALSYICVFVMSLVAAWAAVPALAKIFRLGSKVRRAASSSRNVSVGIRIMQVIYRPFLSFAMSFPKTVIFLSLLCFAWALNVATGFGSSFLPPFREDSFNVMVSLPPGASLLETERVSEACVPAIRSIPGVLSVTRRTGRAERDQHAEPVSSSELVVRVDLKSDTEHIRSEIRKRIGAIPGVSLVVGYPIAHRISAVLSGTEAELAINIFGEDADVLRETAAKIKNKLEKIDGIADIRANREITIRTLKLDYDMHKLVEAGITPREAGEQVAAAFNGVETGEVRNGIRRRSVTVRLEGEENTHDINTVRSFVLSNRFGRHIRLGDIASVKYEMSPNLMLREGGRRKALISCNPSEGVDIEGLVKRMENEIGPIASENGCTLSFGGSYEARRSAARRLALLGAGLIVAIFFILVFALGSARSACLALLNVPFGLIGSVVAVLLAGSVLSVSSLVGFVTVIGFTLRNGILLLNCYRDRIANGGNLDDAIREGSMERMAPIILTSLTTVIGLVPIILGADTPGGELLAPLGVVQFGGLVGASILNLIVLPATVMVFGMGEKDKSVKTKNIIVATLAFAVFAGCKSYESNPIDWDDEMRQGGTNEICISTSRDAALIALAGNMEINIMRLKAASSEEVAKQSGWWEDPELDFDLMRIVNPGTHPFLGGASLSFTIPLSGSLELEKEAEKRYAASDRVHILAAEKRLVSEARKSAIRLAMLQEKNRILKEYDEDKRISSVRNNMEKLHSAGEVSASELAGVRRTVHIRRHAQMDIAREIAKEEIAFLKMSGLKPDAKIKILFVPSKPKTSNIEAISIASLIRHPEVESAVLRLGGTEAQLEAEIRRQYPDLKIGPAYANEEGLDRIGIVAGVTLPLWNRNRKGIATAQAARDEARLTAIDTWRALVCDATAAHSSIVRLMSHPPVPLSEINEVDRLYDAGELTSLEYLSVREEILDQKLSEAEWLGEVEIAYAELEKYK